MMNSFVELKARDRAKALLEDGSYYELLNPFDEIISPHLEAQDIVPQSDDGVVVIKGKFRNKDALIIAIEGEFQGGGIGEVSGAKISAALELVLKENKAGNKMYPIIIFDTGGVRLQEANYGLLSISEIGNMIIALRKHVPVIGLIPGRVGSFGGMSITSALLSTLIATNKARIGLNGPEVIEQEAGVMELDSSDKQLIWDTIGSNQRLNTGLVDQVVKDNIQTIQDAVEEAIINEADVERTEQIDFYLSLLEELDWKEPLTPKKYAERFAKHTSKHMPVPMAKEGKTPLSDSRGYKWFSKLTNLRNPISDVPTVLATDVKKEGTTHRYITIIPNKDNRFYRVREGEVGLQEGFTVAKIVQDAIEQDKNQSTKRPIILVIDVPSQAYGYKEELIGIHLALASSANAYAKARQLGHPVVGVIVGNAISGAFLAHGLQSNRLIALNDPKINVQAMSKESAVRVTQRTIQELENATKKVPAMAYDINNFAKLGALYELLDGIHADDPTEQDIQKVLDSIHEAIISTKDRPNDLRYRYETEAAKTTGRLATLKVRKMMEEQWD